MSFLSSLLQDSSCLHTSTVPGPRQEPSVCTQGANLECASSNLMNLRKAVIDEHEFFLISKEREQNKGTVYISGQVRGSEMGRSVSNSIITATCPATQDNDSF